MRTPPKSRGRVPAPVAVPFPRPTPSPWYRYLRAGLASAAGFVLVFAVWDLISDGPSSFTPWNVVLLVACGVGAGVLTIRERTNADRADAVRADR